MMSGNMSGPDGAGNTVAPGLTLRRRAGMNATEQPAMRIWFDTEFIEDGKTIELLSIGAVREDGAEFYAELAETDRSLASPWVAENVLPLLTGPVISKRDLAAEFVLFAGPAPEFWAYFASYDWVALCQLFGTMMDLPSGWPMWVRDLKQFALDCGIHDLSSLIPQVGEHNALADARWTRDAWSAVSEVSGV